MSGPTRAVGCPGRGTRVSHSDAECGKCGLRLAADEEIDRCCVCRCAVTARDVRGPAPRDAASLHIRTTPAYYPCAVCGSCACARGFMPHM